VSVERTLRNLIVRTPLADSRLIGAVYGAVNRIRFRRRWDEPVNFRGVQLVVGRDLSLYPFLRSGGFEERELDWILARTAGDAVVWDVGANIGVYTVLLAKAAADGHVVAFEPTPDTLVRLHANLARNNIGNVTVEPVALSDTTGTATMRILADAAGGNSLDDTGTSPGPQVPVTTADAFHATGGIAPHVVKVDIEGHEPQFVAGARRILAQARPTLLLEVNGATFLHDAAQCVAWERMVAFLFDVYGSATWFGPTSVEAVRGLSLQDVSGRPCTLAFEAQ
jgi:FkbM family methyltransferase